MGMAMTFALVSHLREQLSGLVEGRLARRIAEDHEKERLAIEVCLRHHFADIKPRESQG